LISRKQARRKHRKTSKNHKDLENLVTRNLLPTSKMS